MLIEVVVGAVLGLVILAVVVATVLKRDPSSLVADRLAEKFYEDRDSPVADAADPADLPVDESDLPERE